VINQLEIMCEVHIFGGIRIITSQVQLLVSITFLYFQQLLSLKKSELVLGSRLQGMKLRNGRVLRRSVSPEGIAPEKPICTSKNKTPSFAALSGPKNEPGNLGHRVRAIKFDV